MISSYRAWLRAGEAQGLRYTLQVPRAALRGLGGARMGREAGSSIDFRDYREYQPGDDLRHIDWNVYARSDKLAIKLFREEVSPQVDLLLDGSRSMAMTSAAKAQAAVTLTAALAVAAANAQCAHRVWLAGDRAARLVNDTDAPSVWEGIAFDGARSPLAAIRAAPPAWRRHGIRVLISDLLWPDDPAQALTRLADQAAAVIVIQVLAPDDLDPVAQGHVRLWDVETGVERDVFVDVAARARYRQTLARHQAQWQRACRQVGALLAQVTPADVIARSRWTSLEEAQILT